MKNYYLNENDKEQNILTPINKSVLKKAQSLFGRQVIILEYLGQVIEITTDSVNNKIILSVEIDLNKEVNKEIK